MSPRVIILFGKDLSVQRAVASELCDLLAHSGVLGFATPLREAYRAVYDLPYSAQESEEERERIADWVEAFRGFFREWAGNPSILGELTAKVIKEDWDNTSYFIIEDGCQTYLDDVKHITKTFKEEKVLIVNFSDVLPLRSNGHAVADVGDQRTPEEIATFIHNSL